MTQAQEKKLDKFAELMQLKPGQHILDVGCGWGGPLVYLCHKYGVTGHGITVSPMSIPVAQARATKYGVDATFEVRHWQKLPDIVTFDAIFTDEVVVHIHDLADFFAKCHLLLKPKGIMVNKELHLTHSHHTQWFDQLSHHINKVFGYTGNYRMLHDELRLVDENNFQLMNVFEIPIEHYQITIGSHWLRNMFVHKERLLEVTTPKHLHDFRLYLKSALVGFRAGAFGQHMVASRKLTKVKE